MNNEFRIGDKVRFLNEKGEGKVCGFRDNMVLVLHSDGIEIPYLPEYLVKVGYEELNRNEWSDFQEKKITDKEFAFFAVLEPDTGSISKNTRFNFFLVNQSEYAVQFSVLMEQSKNLYKRVSGSVLGPYQKIYVHSFAFADFTIHNRIRIDAMFYKSSVDFIPVTPVSETIFVNEKKLSEKTPGEFPGFASRVYYYCLRAWNSEADMHAGSSFDGRATEALDAILLEKLRQNAFGGEGFQSVGERRTYQKKGTMEVDLHFEKIYTGFRRFSNAEILQMQIREFEEKLNRAITENYEKLIVIHGKGAGVLKKEIHRIAIEEYKLKVESEPYKDGGGKSIIYLI